MIADLDGLDPAPRRRLTRALQNRIRRDYLQFENALRQQPQQAVRVPTIRATGISESAILRHKPVSLQRLLDQVFYLEGRISAEQWHKKRILLKRYRHKIDAFVYCPGHTQDEEELKQIDPQRYLDIIGRLDIRK